VDKELDKVIQETTLKIATMLMGHWCNFCGKSRADVKYMMLGPSGHLAICDGCVDYCHKSLQEEKSKSKPKPDKETT